MPFFLLLGLYAVVKQLVNVEKTINHQTLELVKQLQQK